jgi:predicted TIM-barrel fold metal-dependent hydrolase
MIVDELDGTRTSVRSQLTLVDCDVHPYLGSGIRDLFDYMPSAWRYRLGFEHDPTMGTPITIPTNTLFFNPDGNLRRDASRAGEMPASDPGFVAEHLLSAYEIDRAILVGGNVLGLGGMPNPDAAAVVASAYNDWMIEQWIRVDDRYRGALVVAPQDPIQAVAEIDRVGDVPGIVSVFVPLGHIGMGQRHYYPIYEAAERKRLPIQVHPSGTENVFLTGPPMPHTPVYKVEWKTMLPQAHQANLISMICHGVFDRFPALKLVITEGGFAWLPDVLWRLDAAWKAMREEIPWVTQLPSEYVKRHVRLTTQPFLEAAQRDDVTAMCKIVNADALLMFSSDYPHYDFDNPRRALVGLPADQLAAVCSQTALELFGDRLL